jgi:hypothetical protein
MKRLRDNISSKYMYSDKEKINSFPEIVKERLVKEVSGVNKYLYI